MVQYMDFENYIKKLPVRVDKENVYDIFIGRPSIYSNPFITGINGTRSEVLEKYKNYLQNLEDKETFIYGIEGKRIACWCSLGQKCHGDLIIEFIKQYYTEKMYNEIAE